MRLIPQTQSEVKEMIKAGYPPCLKKEDWRGNYPRHCNSCIRMYKKEIKNKEINMTKKEIKDLILLAENEIKEWKKFLRELKSKLNQ